MSESLLDRLKRSTAGPGDPPEVDGAPRFGAFALLQEVGEGATARVFLAWDTRLKRPVALKILKIDSPATHRRFLKEAQLAARLRHPGIVTVYEVGENDGRPFIVLEFVDGAALGERRTPLRRTVEIVRDAARAVHYAHTQGVIHRDLKPRNILLDRDGKVYVTDFGLSKQLDPGTGFTATGVILGTPSYIPPEQAEGRNYDVDARSDIYGLGATLYELLSGRPPFDGSSIYDILSRVIVQEPPPLPSSVPADVRTICAKAMAKEKGDRYATAGALADDLQRFLDHEPILARPVSTFRMMALRVRRHPGRYLGAAAAVVVALAGVVTIALMLRENRRLAAERTVEKKGVDTEAELMAVALQPLAERVEVLMSQRPFAPEEDVQRTADEIRKIEDRFPRRADPCMLRGRLLVSAADFERAADAFTKAIDRAPKSPLAHYWRGRARIEHYMRRKPIPGFHFDESEMSAWAGEEDDGSRALREGAKGDFEWVAAFSAGRDDYYSVFARGANAVGERKYADAIRELEQATKMSTACAEAHFLLGVAHFHGRDWEKALASINLAWNQNFRTPLMLAIRAISIVGLARRQGEGSRAYEELMLKALESANDLVKIRFDDAQPYGFRALLQLQRAQARLYAERDPSGPAEAAIVDLEKAASIKPDDETYQQLAIAHNTIGDWHRREGRDGRAHYRSALEAADEALKRGGGGHAMNERVDALYGLALLDRTRDAFDAAVAASEELVGRADAPLTAFLRLAQLRLERAADDADFERAARSCGDALERNPRYVTAYVIRSEVWLKWARALVAGRGDAKEKFEKALDDAKRAVQLEENTKTFAARAEVYDAIGVWKAGRTPQPPAEFEHAVADYEKAYVLSGFATYAANDWIVARLHRANVCEAYKVATEYRELEEFITQVIRKDDTEPLLLANRGHVRMRLKNYRGARDDFEAASRGGGALAADLADDLEEAKRRLGD